MIHIWCPWKLSNFQDPPSPVLPLRLSTTKIFSPPWPWTSNFKRTPPFQMVTNKLKEKIIQRKLLHVIRSFFLLGFCFQYQLINFVWLCFDFFHLAEASLPAFSRLYTTVCGIAQKYHKISFIYNYSHF